MCLSLADLEFNEILDMGVNTQMASPIYKAFEFAGY